MKRMKFFVRIFFVTLLITLCMHHFFNLTGKVNRAFAGTYEICKENNCEFKTFQDVTTELSDGDIVIVHPGTYEEYAYITANITLQSSSGNPDDTAIDGGLYMGRGGTVQGFTIKNGGNSGIKFDGSNMVVVDNCIIMDNEYNSGGGGIHLTATTREGVEISNSEIYNNTSTNGGGGIYIAGPTDRGIKVSNTIIRDNIVSGSGSSHGGGIYIRYNTNDVTIENSTITGNTVSGPTAYGGGISQSNTTNTTIYNTTISGNAISATGSAYGGGIYSVDVLSMSGVTITGNSLSAAKEGIGGGVYSSVATTGESSSFSDVTISNNTITEVERAYGGGLRSYDDLTITGGNISGNSLSGTEEGQGGGIYVSYGDNFSLADTNVTSNIASETGGGIYCYNFRDTLAFSGAISGNQPNESVGCFPGCVPGETQSCSTGESGICESGTRTCDANGEWGACVRDNEPGEEVCDGRDNDCDGETDEGCSGEMKSEYIENDDSYTEPENNPSTQDDKNCRTDGGLFNDMCNECDECPPDSASTKTNGSLTNDTPDPVTLHNGEFYLRKTDLTIPGRGFDWKFTRTYKSRITYDGPLGHNWDFNYNSKLVEITEENVNSVDSSKFPSIHGESFTKVGSLIVMDGFSRSDIYGLQEDGTYSPVKGAYVRLTKTEEGSFELRDSEGNKKTYDSNGYYIRLEDRHGNYMTFLRDEEGKPVEVIDTMGRSIYYFYNDSGRLTEVKDFTDRSLKFEYNEAGDLVAVTSPAVTGTLTGNDFPEGKKELYTYSSGYSDNKLNHDLLTITAPNETATGGIPRTIIEYGTDSDAYSFGRVVKMTYGGTNAEGIVAGGDIIYQYEELTTSPLTTNDPVNRVTVTDRNGNITVYEHNRLGNAVSIREYTKGLRTGEPEYYETSYEYNEDGERIRSVLPEGEVVENLFPQNDPLSTNYKTERLGQGNLVMNILIPDNNRNSDQAHITTFYNYEPIYNRLRIRTDPRGFDESYVPQNGGNNSPERYFTVNYFDYQEGNNHQALAEILGITEEEVRTILDGAGIPMGLGDLNGDGVTTNAYGDIVRVQHPNVTLLSDSGQAALEGDTNQESYESYTYNRYGQVTSYTDSEGNVSIYKYYSENDPDGDGENPVPGKGGEEYGYLRESVADRVSSAGRNSGTNPTPAMIKRQYFYDDAGNRIKVINGRGVSTHYVVNQLNQVTQIVRAAETPAGLDSFSYNTFFEYDHNDNLVIELIENRDSNNTEPAGEYIVHGYTYDILDNVVRETKMVSLDETIVREFRYDGNENRTTVTEPEGNFHETTYDERDLKFQIIKGAGGPFGGEPSVTTYKYDGNRNLIEVTDGEDNNGDGINDSTLLAYDGFDRLKRVTDPAGDIFEQLYDPAGNIIAKYAYGSIGGMTPADNSGTGNVLLSQSEYFFDEKNRMFQKEDILFVSDGVTTVRTPVFTDGPLGVSNNGRVTTRYEYDKRGRRTFVTEDDRDRYAYQYDGADRLLTTVDPEGNSKHYSYDENNNMTRIIETEITQDGNRPVVEEEYVIYNFYDSLDRLILTADNLYHTDRFYYDSRSNLILTTDANGELLNYNNSIQYNSDGNGVHYYYDGLNRKILEEKYLRVDGQGSGSIETENPYNPDGKISTFYDYDRNSRLTTLTDDNGNTTQYAYDNLNRLTSELFTDNTTNQYEYDRDNNLSRSVDSNGSVINAEYDALNRVTQMNITRAEGVTGTTFQSFEYDGLSRRTVAFDNNDPDTETDDALVTYAFDSLSRLIEEVQNDRVISNRWDGDNKRLAMVYPGGLTIEATYDGLDRIDRIGESEERNFIADFDYLGAYRILERTYGNGVRLTYLDEERNSAAGYDGVKRVVNQKHMTNNNVTIANYMYGYDRENNKLYEARLHETDDFQIIADLYSYDSAYRLKEYRKDTVYTADAGVTENNGIVYTLDGVGNWAEVSGDYYSVNTINEMNEYTVFNGSVHLYDHNGNLITDAMFTYEYDFANRLKKVTRNSDGLLIAAYHYDAHGTGRRIGKIVTNMSELNGNTGYYYDGIHRIEEHGSDGSINQYVYGMGTDELLLMNKDNNGDAAIDESYYYHSDARKNVVALTDVLGNVVERYLYSDYGITSILDSTGSPISAQTSSIQNDHQFSGRLYDGETGLYYFRARYYNPETGRFLQRDPMRNQGRLTLYQYAGGNPIVYGDPFGMEDEVQQGNLTDETAVEVTGGASRAMNVAGTAGHMKWAERALEGGKAVDNYWDAYRQMRFLSNMSNLNCAGPDVSNLFHTFKRFEELEKTVDAAGGVDDAAKKAGTVKALKTVGQVGNALQVLEVGANAYDYYKRDERVKQLSANERDRILNEYERLAREALNIEDECLRNKLMKNLQANMDYQLDNLTESQKNEYWINGAVFLRDSLATFVPAPSEWFKGSNECQ